jgi:uncharacterized protein YkwD
VSFSRRTGTLVALAGLALALPAPVPASAAATRAASAADGSCRDVRLIPNRHNAARVRKAVLCLMNVERTSRGLRPLRASAQLRSAATAYSRTMVRKRFFAHVSPQGSTMLSRIRKGTSYLQRVRDWALGENLGWGAGAYATPAHMVQEWMDSAGHRDNILNARFRHVGIGVATGAPMHVRGARAATYTIDFGFRT